MEGEIQSHDFGEREVIREIGKLPIKLRSTLILYAIEGYSVKEISVILQISEAAVKKRLQRSREKLNIQLEGEK